ncbi:hypothetical protein Tco_0303886, partial [Tanacetum coccineum]
MKHLDHVAAIDVLVDQGLASNDDLVMRNESLIILSDFDKSEAKDLAQKANKVKWTVEGDENTKFFHGVLKKKRRNMAIKGPDGLTFAFFKHFWSIIEEDVVRFVEDFSVTAHIPKGCNPSFIALIPKVLDPKVMSDFRPISLIGCQYKKIDGPLILNEVMEWYRKRKRRLMIFKVDFWEFLDLVMAKIGFAPIDEYEICRGLRQGDPLFPFLFILAMEGLHVVIRKALQIGLFKGALIGERGFLMSHLMYADDVIFMGDWSFQNVNNLIGILRCFFLTPGLKINVQKSKLLGVRVDHEESSELASILGYEDVVDKFKHKLSTWNSRILSVGDLEDRKMTWVAWKKCLASKEHGGWVVIKNTHRNSGRIGKASFPSSASSPWIVILKATKHLMEKGIDLLSLCKRKVGDESLISFWDDDWCGDRPLKLQFPRVYALDDVKSCTVVERLRLLDWFSVFRRPPRGGDEILQYTA